MIFERPENDSRDNESQYTDYPVEPERQGEGEEGEPVEAEPDAGWLPPSVPPQEDDGNVAL